LSGVPAFFVRRFNLFYIDQLNQDYDNPILRKELIAPRQKKRLERVPRKLF
jgi:hypothetical protein